MSTLAYDDSRYFLTIVDDYSRCTWIYLLKAKSDTRVCLESFSNMVECQFNTRIKTLPCDNGPEFHMTTFFHNKGIIHQTSCIETPQQNGVVKCNYQHIRNVAQALCFQAHLPLKYWNN